MQQDVEIAEAACPVRWDPVLAVQAVSPPVKTRCSWCPLLSGGCASSSFHQPRVRLPSPLSRCSAPCSSCLFQVGDLGLSKIKKKTMCSGGVRGTLPWMAPELLDGNSHFVTEKVRRPGQESRRRNPGSQERRCQPLVYAELV